MITEIKEINELKEIAKQNLPKFIRKEDAIKYACLEDGQAILDIDTTGLNAVDDEIISYCIIRKDNLKLVCRCTATEEELLEELKNDLQGIHTIISYTYFEDEWLSSKFEPELLYNYIDLSVDSYIGLHNVIKYDYKMENLHSHDIPLKWKRWGECDFHSLEQIVRHTLGDALRKLALLVIDGNVRKPIVSKDRKTALIHDIIYDAEEIGIKEIRIDEIVKMTGYPMDEVKELLNELIEDGEIYEPKAGVYRLL